ncbi:MAG: YggS family pyridoxal phosphate-dependent enzyme [Planctomycetes bacterium]|nr:YggS family pyridoxal phosphate-dependent enzyme [Planctomycetota bacterium]
MPTSEGTERLRRNLADVRATIAEASRRAGRDAADVRLVAVTKYVDLDTIRALLAAGVRDLGENRVQQLSDRAQTLGAADLDLLTPPPEADALPRWHMIGHLQRNKVKALLRHTRILHSLDSVRLAYEIEKQAERLDLTVDAFLEFNVAGELAKSGAPVDEAGPLAEAATQCQHIRVHGLMTMPPFDPDPEAARPCFARLRELLEKLQRDGAVGPDCVHLSMGMTIDYAAAVEEGATFVRIGSALFEGVTGD